MGHIGRKTTAIFLLLATLANLCGCDPRNEIQYEIEINGCSDDVMGNVLFLYPHKQTTTGFALEDGPETVFAYLEGTVRFLERAAGETVAEDVVYLSTACGNYAIFHRGEIEAYPGWPVYDIRKAELGYFERTVGSWAQRIAEIPFPIHLLPRETLDMAMSIMDDETVLPVAYDAILDYPDLIGDGIVDAEAGTITYAGSDTDGFSIVIRDLGDGTVRVDKTEDDA
ncbi:MAG: hypothetical protein WC509_08605 [Candidatus Izemoplasmatales bacterium]